MRLVVMLVAILLAGCGIHTRTVRLDLPARTVVSPNPGLAVVVLPVIDGRQLTNAPSSAGYKIEAGLLKALGPEKAASLIAGVGDSSKGYAVLLQDEEPVSELMRKFVTEIFEAKGYAVYSASQLHPDAPLVDVRVTQFYLNQPFNFFRALTWTNQMKATIATDVTVSDGRGRRVYSVIGHGANIVQTGKDANYQETYAKAMDDYSRDFNAKVFDGL